MSCTFDMSKVNVNGGAISLGHPSALRCRSAPDAKHGLATLCIGGGMGVATVYEKC